MAEKYKDEFDEIHAPVELIERTRTAMRREQKKSRKRVYRWTAAAACLCIAVAGGFVWHQASRTDIRIENVDLDEGSQWETGISLGQHKVEEEQGKSIEWREVKKEEIPKEVTEAKTSRIKGKEVHICREEDKSAFYAAWQTDGSYYYVTGRNVTKEEFTAYLKNIL